MPRREPRRRPVAPAPLRRGARDPTGAAGQGLQLPRRRRHQGDRRRDARTHPRHRDPAGLDRRAHQRRSRLAPPGGGPRPAGSAAVQVPPRLDRVPRPGEVRPPPCVRKRAPGGPQARSTPTSRCPAIPRDKVLATVVELLQTTLIRVGNEEYARENGAYGLTTLPEPPRPHLRLRDRPSSSPARAGSPRGARAAIAAWPRCCATARRSAASGSSSTSTTTARPPRVHSHDVNDYLRETAGADITAKDFRTWVATVATASALGSARTADVGARGARRSSRTRSKRSPPISATRPRCVAHRTCTRACWKLPDRRVARAWSTTPPRKARLTLEERRTADCCRADARRERAERRDALRRAS